MTGLEGFDEVFEEIFGAEWVDAAAPTIPNGFYTLTFPDGSHRTFRIHTKKPNAKFAPGQRIISVLIGPNNTEDYESFGFVSNEGVKVWKRHKDTKLDRYAETLWMLATGCEADGHTLAVSKRCYVCNRTLTDPTSLELGIGPLCRERMRG